MSNEKKNDGGPAFPVNTEMLNGGLSPSSGMSLRDYFAAKAMHAWWSDEQSASYPGATLSDKVEHERLIEEWREKLRKESAEWSYKMADEMLKAREQ